MPKARQNPDFITAKDLILWARKEHIALQHVTVGGISVVMMDRKLGGDMPRKPIEEERKGIYEDMAGPLLAMVSAQNEEHDDVEPTIEDDD